MMVVEKLIQATRTGLVLALLLGTSTAPATEPEAETGWERAGRETREAWEAAREATSALWGATRESGEEAWETTRETSAETWEATREFSNRTWRSLNAASETFWENMEDDESSPPAITDEAGEPDSGAEH